LGSQTGGQFLIFAREAEQPGAKRPDRLSLRHPAKFGGAIAVQRRSTAGGGLDISDDP